MYLESCDMWNLIPGFSHFASCFQVHPCRSVSRCFTRFHGWILFHRLERPRLVCPFISWLIDVWTASTSSSATVNRAAVNTCIHVLTWTYVFILLAVYLGVELLGHTVTLCLTSRRATKLLSRATAPFYLPAGHIRGF